MSIELIAVSKDELLYGFELASCIATCLMSLTLIGSIVGTIFYFKNRLTKKTFQINFSVIRKFTNCILCSIDFMNFTDREFSIISCHLILDGKDFEMSDKVQLSDFPLCDFVSKKNIFLEPHESKTFNPIYFPVQDCICEKANFEIKTTQGNLIYKVNLKSNNS